MTHTKCRITVFDHSAEPRTASQSTGIASIDGLGKDQFKIASPSCDTERVVPFEQIDFVIIQKDSLKDDTLTNFYFCATSMITMSKQIALHSRTYAEYMRSNVDSIFVTS